MVHQRDFQKTETVTSESSQEEPVHHVEICNKILKGCLGATRFFCKVFRTFTGFLKSHFRLCEKKKYFVQDHS